MVADFNKSRRKENNDYESFVASTCGNQNDYEIVDRLGGGKYSEVYGAVNVTNNNKPCVIKILKPIFFHKIKREIKVLQTLSGGPNIVKLFDVIREPETERWSLVCERLYNTVTDFTDDDIRDYMYQLLKALNYCHSKGIMHRDVKPQNIVIDHEKRELTLIDWGLAEFYEPRKQYSVHVASRCYKAPELLVGLKEYDFSIDMWSVGCMLAEMIFHPKRPKMVTRPFFRSGGGDVLHSIVRVLGTEKLKAYVNKHKIDFHMILRGNIGMPWKNFITDENRHLVNDEALDLLDKLLCYDHKERLTAKEAMGHRYFDRVRNSHE